MKTLPLLLLTTTLAASAAEQEVSWRSLFNGEDLSHWSGDGYEVVDGAIVCTPEGKNLVTEALYANYVLEFEFKLPPAGNNGLGIHYPGHGDAAYTGMEIQILDDSAPKWSKLKDYQYHGSIYTMVPAERGHLEPVGEWNHQRVTVFGPRVEVVLNGETITTANLDELEEKFPDHAGVRRRAGHLALCGHGDRVAFRKLHVAELPPAANVEEVRRLGYRPLFDGTTLEGWKVEPGSEEHWIAENGMIRYDGRSTAKEKNLWSEEEFEDFTLVCDWRWRARGPKRERPVIDAEGNETGDTVMVEDLDSGIYLRGSSKSQINLWNWPVGSGEIYGYRNDRSQPAEVRAGATPSENADKPIGEWNRMMITLKGERVSVWLNGRQVLDEARLPGIPERGPLALQHHGAAIDFANLWLLEH